MIKIGIVGTGWMATDRANVFSRLDGVEVSGIYSRTLDKAVELSASIGTQAYVTLSELLANCDAVVISTPNCTHFELASEALSAGKHVLVEYPLCTSMEDAETLRAESVKHGCVLMVGNTIIHEAMFGYLNQNLERLGNLVSASSRVAFYGEENAGHWYMNTLLSGPRFATFHYHHIEYFKRLLGEVEWVLAQDQSTPDESRPGYDKFAGGTLMMGHESGRTSTIQWYLASSGNGIPRGFWLNGTSSSVTIVSVEPDKSQIIWDGGGDGNIDTLTDNWGVEGSCRDFIDTVDGRLDHIARLESDIRTLQIALTANLSAQSGRRLDVD